MMMMMIVMMVMSGLVSGESEVQGPYLDSFTIQDSCQFSLCGPEFTREFLQGKEFREKVEEQSGQRAKNKVLT